MFLQIRWGLTLSNNKATTTPTINQVLSSLFFKVLGQFFLLSALTLTYERNKLKGALISWAFIHSQFCLINEVSQSRLINRLIIWNSTQTKASQITTNIVTGQKSISLVLYCTEAKQASYKTFKLTCKVTNKYWCRVIKQLPHFQIVKDIIAERGY